MFPMLFGLGAWTVNQIKEIKKSQEAVAQLLHQRISEMRDHIDKQVDNNRERIAKTDTHLAVIQETLNGLSTQITAFAEITNGTMKQLSTHSQQIGVIEARCEAIQEQKRTTAG